VINKFPVSSVSQDPYTDGSVQPSDQTYYDYSQGSPAWKLDISPLTPNSKRTWGVFAGFSKVRVKHGDVNTPSLQQTTDYTYFRGMDGDISSPSGDRREVTLTASDGTAVSDAPAFAGRVFEAITRNGFGGPIVTNDITVPWSSATTAVQSDVIKVGSGGSSVTISRSARYVGEDDARTLTTLSSGGPRESEVKTTHDALGRVTKVNDLGDTSTAADDQCTTTSYTDNTGAWLLQFPSEVRVVGEECGSAPSLPDDAISDARTFYDGSSTFGAAPTRGDVTQAQVAKDYDSSQQPVWLTTATNTYDGLGRQLSAKDQLNRTTSTAYTPTFNPATPLTVGQLVTGTTEFFTRDGDVNQEDITNDAVNAWSAMSCWHFNLTDNPGVNHFELPSNPDVLARLIADANAPRSNCP
jgi:hypothetical protein